jgi:hypothetical protein
MHGGMHFEVRRQGRALGRQTDGRHRLPQEDRRQLYENAWKKDGKVTVNATVSVSKDGKTLTVTQTGKEPGGAVVSSVAVYDKQ